MITASQADRALGCPGSFALPQARTTSAWAQQGTENHAEAEQAIEAGEVTETMQRIMGDAAATARAEVKLAYDVATGKGRILGYGSDRGYRDLGPFEIPGTADVLAYDAERVYVGDRKLWRAVTPARSNGQLATLALAATRALGLDEATVWLEYEHGGVDRATLDVLELDEFAAKLRRAHAAVAKARQVRAGGSMPDVAEGPYCKHCPAQHACPAKAALVRRLVTGGEADELEMMIPLTVDTARIAYERLGHARNLLRRIEAAVYAFASETPIQLGDGRVLGRRTKPANEELDGRIARAAIAEVLGEEVAEQAAEVVVTKTAIKAAAKEASPRGKAAAAERQVLELVRQRGGAKRGDPREVVEEFTPKLELVNGGGS